MWLVVLFRYLKRVALLCIVLAMGLLAVSVQAQPNVPALEVLSTSALLAPDQAKLQDVQVLPGTQWQNFNPQKIYPVSKDTSLWVRLELSVSTPPNGWIIKVPKPYIDRVELHFPTASGAWTLEAAGDMIIHSTWPVRGLHPQFLLPALAEGKHTVFLKIANSVPLSASVQLLSTQDSLSNSLGHIIRSAGIMMLLLCMTLISAFMAWLYRDTAYAWYSAYALSAALTVAAYTGLGNYLLWPHAVFWPERSIHVSLLISIVLQIMFCYLAFEPQKIWPRFTALVWLSVLLTVAGIAAILQQQPAWVYAVGLIIPMVLNWFIVMSMVAVRLCLGDLSAKLWMLAYMPLAAVIIAATLEGFGLLPEAIVGFYWPLYCLAFEVPVLLLALMLRAKSLDAHAVTQHTRQQLDPLTGFILPSAYEGLAVPTWEKSTALDLDLAVVYVQITQPSLPFLKGRSQAPGSERIVRVLRTVFRQEDLYAQLRDDVYAVLMPGKALGEPLQNRLTRLVVQLHMLSQELKTDYPLRTRVAACSSRSLTIPWPDVHRILLEKFSHEKNWGKRTILIVSKRHSQRRDYSGLSNFWARAVEVEANFNRTSSP
jgi:two-component system, sensor histidine kinase LadS